MHKLLHSGFTLTELLQAKVKFVWSPESQLAFDNIKSLLYSSPILVAPCFNQPCVIHVDASQVGDGQGVVRPVCYFSKRFNQYQQNYSVIEKEALSLVWALQHLNVYVGAGGPTVVYTDHNPLTFLSSLKYPKQRLTRWSLFLQSYDLDIKHTKGSDNVIADALSRAPQ